MPPVAMLRAMGLLLAIYGTAPTPAPATVIGVDERADLTHDERDAYASVGLVTAGDPEIAVGVGFLVCDCRTVVTAAHVLDRQDGKGDGLYFQQDGRAELRIRIDRAAAVRPGLNPQPSAPSPLGDVRRDWAVAKLDRATPDCLPLSYKFDRPLVRIERVSLVGFHQDYGRIKKISRLCAVGLGGDASGGVLIHTCDLTAGASGSPILLTEANGQSYVVAVQSSEANSLGFNVATVLVENVLGRLEGC